MMRCRSPCPCVGRRTGLLSLLGVAWRASKGGRKDRAQASKQAGGGLAALNRGARAGPSAASRAVPRRLIGDILHLLSLADLLEVVQVLQGPVRVLENARRESRLVILWRRSMGRRDVHSPGWVGDLVARNKYHSARRAGVRTRRG